MAGPGDTKNGSILSLLLTGCLKDGTPVAERDCVITRNDLAVSSAIQADEYLLAVITPAENYPNPFRPATVTGYGLPKAGNLSIGVYHLAVPNAATLVADGREPTYSEAERPGRDKNELPVADGLFFHGLQADGIVYSRKMVLLKQREFILQT